MPVPAFATSPRARRWLARAVVPLLALYVLYLIAGNVFFNTSIGQDVVNRKPEKFRIEWSGGHTFWPGRVALREVRMQGHVRRTLWSVRADRASGRVALLPLLRKQIRLPWVEAESVTGAVGRAQAELPPPESRPGGWTLRIDRIASDSVGGGEVFGWAVAGRGTVEVGFSKQFRGGPAELFPSKASFADARVSRDGADWLREGRVDATFAMAPNLSAEYPGLKKLPLFTATLDLDAKTVALHSVLDEAGNYRFEAMPGEGRAEATLALDRGALAKGGRLRVHTPLHSVDADGVGRDNVFDLMLDVDDDLRLRARVPEQAGYNLALDADLHMPGNALPLQDWRERLMRSTGSARGRWHVPSIGGLLALFTQADWLDVDGSGTVEADLQLADGRLAEGSRLRVQDVDAQAAVLGNRFSGRARAEARIEAAADGTARSQVSLAMDRFLVAPGGAPASPYVEGDDLRVDLESDARLDRMRETLQARIRFDGARVPALAAFNPYLPGGGLRFAGGSGRLTGDLRVDGDGEVGEGTLRVDAPKAALALAGLDLRGDVVIDGRLRRGSLQKGNFDLGGSRVALRNVAFSERGGTSRSGWWATVDLERGHVAWKRPSSAGGKLRARMKDVDFLLAMFADRADYPAWIGKVVDAGEVRLDGRWDWRGDALVLDRMHAANERFRVDARLKLQGNARRGDLYASWGRLGVGLELQGAGHQLHLRNAREWFHSRPDLLR